MNRFIMSLFYYNSDDEETDIINNTKLNAGGGSSGGSGSSGINTNITYTIPPYQYNSIYAYPRRYK